MRSLKTYALVALLLAAGPALAQTLTGSITGTVRDEQGAALPGATVTLTGKTGARTMISEAGGTYRFAALDPGTYSVEATMNGFRSQRFDNLGVTVGKTLSIDFGLKVGGRTESVDVIGESPVVDVSTSASNTELGQDLLFNMPIRQGNTATNLLNFLPAINNSSAYGGDGSSGNGLLIDGVDTRDPSGGTAWTFYNYNIVEEVQNIGLGAPAEYGAFTGAIINTLTKSGGNRYAGLFDIIYTKSSFASKNVPDDFIKKNPALGNSATTKKLVDFTTQFSGPLIKDKLFFFASAQRYHINQDPAGPRTVRDEVSPRLNLKLTWQPNPNDNLMGHLQYDEYNIIGRSGLGDLISTDDQTNQEDAPEYVWNVQWKHLFGSHTFTDVKYTGWWGYFDLTPQLDVPVRFEGTTSLYTGGQGWFYLADRGRHQVNAAVTHYADKYGHHEMKFGVEIERSKTRDRYGYVNDTYYYDYGGKPYLAYNYSYDIAGRNQRESLYAQDAWRVSDRLTINPGVRADFVRGKHPTAGKVYSSTNIAPRLGFAFDVTGDQKTVVKGSYGQYYEGIFNDLYKLATPGYQPRITWDVSACPSINQPCPMSLRVVDSVTNPPTATIDPDMKHPRVDEWTLGFERALTNDVRLLVTGAYRENKNFVGSVLPLARWTAKTVTSTAVAALPATTITVYNWANRSASQGTLLITNPDGFQFLDPNGNVLGTIDAHRKYKALMFVLRKRQSHRWYGQLSYVLSKADGTIDNTSEGLFGPSRFYQTPTLALVNVQGPMTNDRTHEIKAMLGWQVPVVDIGINAYFRSLTGRPYAAFQRFSSSAINFSSYFGSSAGRSPFLEPRGNRRRPTENILDMRLEKIVNLGGRRDRLAVYADITNVTNQHTELTRLTRVPSTSISTAPGQSVSVPFDAPSLVISPRQATFGFRWSF
jgi:Carboxypeptidase regulatory-like domain/TonB dependent receptor-like, beta-barrel